MSAGIYEEKLPCGGVLKVSRTAWEIYYYFPGPDLRYNGTSVTVPGSAIEQYVSAFEANWAEYIQLKSSIPNNGAFEKVGQMGMAIRVGKAFQGVCIRSYFMPIGSGEQLDTVTASYRFAAERAPQIQKLFFSSLAEPVLEPIDVSQVVLDWEKGRDSFQHDVLLQALMAGVSVNTRDERGRTPLIRASINGDLNLVSLFLKHGADVHLVDQSKQSAIFYACVNKHPEVVALLELHDADLSQKVLAESILDRIAIQDSVPSVVREVRSAWEKGQDVVNQEVLLIALKAGGVVNTRDEHGRTPLIRASIAGDDQFVTLLLSYGAYVDAKDFSHQSALYYACVNGHQKLTELLESRGADPAQRASAEAVLAQVKKQETAN